VSGPLFSRGGFIVGAVAGPGGDGEEGVGKHGEGGVAVPGPVPADLVVVEPGLAFRLGSPRFPISRRRPRQARQGDRTRRPAAEERQLKPTFLSRLRGPAHDLRGKDIGWGANPASAGTPGGGSGGAIYTDGDNDSVTIAGTIIRNNSAREGGGAVFFVVDNNEGTLTIKDSTLHNNPSGEFFTAGYPGIFFHSSGHPIVIGSTIN
jgi:Chlamydia polymorphic membrane protein (Chlamydia_PMP) repeat